MPENTAEATGLWAALQYFLDLDDPYLGVDQERIMQGQAALNSLRTRMAELEQALEKIRDLDLDDDTLWVNRDTPLAPKAVSIARRALDQEERG